MLSRRSVLPTARASDTCFKLLVYVFMGPAVACEAFILDA